VDRRRGRDGVRCGGPPHPHRSLDDEPAVSAAKIAPSIGAPRQNWNAAMIVSATTQRTTLVGQLGAEARGRAAVRVTRPA